MHEFLSVADLGNNLLMRLYTCVPPKHSTDFNLKKNKKLITTVN